MKIFIAMLASVFITAVFASSSKDKLDHWVLIPEINYEGIRVYYDASGLTNSVVEKVKINVGSVLVSSDTVTKIDINGESFLARSQVKVIAIECKSGLSGTLYDIFFIESKPLDDSKPVAVFEYSIDDPSKVIRLPKSSPVRTRLCSVEI